MFKTGGKIPKFWNHLMYQYVTGILFFQIPNLSCIKCYKRRFKNSSFSLWAVCAGMQSVVLFKDSIIQKHKILSNHLMISGFVMYIYKVTRDIPVARQKFSFNCCLLFLKYIE